tara:strand:+ start:4539 stop:6008 length:1470 start_codon:yes stop_codon:yes gene_type:complete
MSDKKQPEQLKAKADNKTSAASSNVDNQPDLSTAINVDSPLAAAEKKSADIDSPKKAPEKNQAKAADNKNNNKPAVDKTPDKSTAPVKDTTANKSTPSTTNRAKTPQENNSKISKIALLALIIALLAIGASAGHYYWSEQQKLQYSLQLDQNLQRQLVENQQQIAQQLLQNKQQIAQQFLLSKQANTTEITALRNKLAQLDSLEQSRVNTLAQLEQKIVSLGQNQPNDWLLQEAEYLIRVASRSLWLEKDTRTAISLLNDANLRIAELNDPQFLPLRQIIQQDIAKLELLPKLKTDEVILKLMTLAQQTQQLPLTKANNAASTNKEIDLQLTENASDWRENLAKTWHNITAKFLTISKKTADSKALMSPEFTQNLRENLNLKLQTAIWAASKMNQGVYQQSLSEVSQWLNDYFDMAVISNQNFAETIVNLQNKTISAEYPNKLEALVAIRQLLSSKNKRVNPVKEKPKAVELLHESVIEQANAESQEGA